MPTGGHRRNGQAAEGSRKGDKALSRKLADPPKCSSRFLNSASRNDKRQVNPGYPAWDRCFSMQKETHSHLPSPSSNSSKPLPQGVHSVKFDSTTGGKVISASPKITTGGATTRSGRVHDHIESLHFLRNPALPASHYLPMEQGDVSAPITPPDLLSSKPQDLLLNRQRSLLEQCPSGRGRGSHQEIPADPAPIEIASDEEIIFHGRLSKSETSSRSHERLSSDFWRKPEQSESQTNEEALFQSPTKKGKARENDLPESSFTGVTASSDYIANLEANDEGAFDLQNLMTNGRDLGGSDGWENDLMTPKKIENQRDGWDRAHIIDFDDLGTSSEELGQVGKVLARRRRENGLQYLVTSRNSITDDTKWLPMDTLAISSTNARLIQEYEASQRALESLSDPSISEGSIPDEEQIELDVQTAMDEANDDKDLEQRKIARMTDEKIARLLSKQEELGITSSDLMLFDGNDLESSPDGIPYDFDGRRRRTLRTRRPYKPGREQTHRAAIMQDGPWAFDGVLDETNRVARKGLKGPTKGIDFGLSDSELESNLRTSWEKDRSKKKAKKAERAELRAQGLLGLSKKDKRKVDLKAKYPHGIKFFEIKEEIKDFLKAPEQNLALPPMDPHGRKLVHEMCHKLGMTSRSKGNGHSRYPVLYKTSRTQPFNENVSGHVHRLFFPKPGQSKKNTADSQGKRRGKNAKAAAYQDGEIVGAFAPELDGGNKGRAMLEKMGWSMGTALGAVNNPGIPVPVAQIIKTSRAGLG